MKQLRQLRSYKDSTPKRSARVNGLVCRADLRVIAIPGALRKASTNNGLLRAAAQVVPDGMHVVQADISQLPLYNDDLWASGVPDSVANFREQIDSADALLFSVPEYNYSLPGPHEERNRLGVQKSKCFRWKASHHAWSVYGV